MYAEYNTIHVRAVLYDRKWDFEDLVKDGDVLAVYKATTRATCSSYCLAWQCHSFFFNNLTFECRLLNNTFSTNTGSATALGSTYFTISQGDAVPAAPLPGGCSPSALSDGFTYDATSGLCFKIHNNNVDWTRAKTDCTDEGYRLIVLNNALKADFMANLLDSDSDYTNDGYWMGLSQVNDWEDGTPLTYNNWFDLFQILNTGKCGLLYRVNNYKWKSEHCNSARGFICEAA
ncbi:snaclec coagulation factor IX/factor X-binding protein subunit B3-like [Haliotis rubra]|uniref:snaclec coagulation factor IX/factor X-binding protein subunit B3-like n=1 Tax=Haliotis rubra TaxID=36100 RepID=UPI001EE5185B|nr:snaclec coagulation factor IX/factor X-binding protein subunit B3-like [Haliotis rubra]